MSEQKPNPPTQPQMPAPQSGNIRGVPMSQTGGNGGMPKPTSNTVRGFDSINGK